MSNNRHLPLAEQFLSEIWDEISALEGHALDEFLKEVGLNPELLLQHYANSVGAAGDALKRSRYEEAKKHVRDLKNLKPTNLISFDLSKKRQILTAIKERTAKTNEMTIAARHQRIDAEGDLDSFLEACVRLGIIDEDGNLKQ